MLNLEKFATPIKAKNKFIKACFGGFAGSGKTRTSSELLVGAYKLLKCKKPILMIDNEKGSRFLIPFFEKHGIKTYIKETVYLADTLEAFELLKNNEIDFLFIDSLTKIWYQFVKEYKKKNQKTFMTLQDWGKILPAWQEQFSDIFVNLEGNIIFTGRGGFTYDMEENPDTHKKEFIKSGVKMKLAGETPFEPDLNIWMEQEQEISSDGILKIFRTAQIMKDRSGLIDGEIFKNPVFENFKPVIEYLYNVPIGEVAGATNTSNLAPSETYSDKKEKRDILLEKIKAEFDKFQFGTDKDSKSLKVMILEKIFKTSSGTEIEKMSLMDLEICYGHLVELFAGWEINMNKIEYINKFEPMEAPF